MDIGAEICRAIKKEERGCGYQPRSGRLHDALSPFCPHSSIGFTAVVGARYIYTPIIIIISVIIFQNHHVPDLINISTSTMSIIIIFSLLTLRPHIDNFENRPKWLSVLLWHQHALVLCQTLLNCLLPPETCVSRIRWPWILNFALRLLILSKIRPLSIVVSLYCIEEAFWLERGIEHIEESLIASFRGGIESPHKGSVRLELGPNPKVWDEMDNHCTDWPVEETNPF